MEELSKPDQTLLGRLRERTKELTLLHAATRILQDESAPEGKLIEKIVQILPAAWQYPEITAACVTVGEDVFPTPSFRKTTWGQSASFSTNAGIIGRVEVYYLEEKPKSFEGPFLAEERDLIDTVAEMLRAFIQRRSHSRALKEANERLESQVAERTAALKAEMEEHQQSRAQIARHHGQLRHLAHELALTEDRERRAIASDLHDQIGQTLVFIKSKIRSLQGDAIFSGFDKNISAILKLLDNAIRATRSLTSEISPPVLYELGLLPALKWLADQFDTKHGLKVTVIEETPPGALGTDLRAMLFKCVRELLVNAFKHARATRVEVRARRVAGEVVIEVLDDGIGFDVAAFEAAAVEEKGFGLFSIKERLEQWGGTMRLDSTPGLGTRVALTVGSET